LAARVLSLTWQGAGKGFTRSSTVASGARRADVTGLGVPEHHGDGSALPMLVQSGNLSLEIWNRVDVG
jgi:hypothetical protein